MIHPETHIVTPENGVRPSGQPDECAYCKQKLGSEHKPDCVCRQRTVLVKATITYAIKVPESWTPHDIEFHRNDSSWCADNMIEELQGCTEDNDRCLCCRTEFEYFGEATEQDEKDASLYEKAKE